MYISMYIVTMYNIDGRSFKLSKIRLDQIHNDHSYQPVCFRAFLRCSFKDCWIRWGHVNLGFLANQLTLSQLEEGGGRLCPSHYIILEPPRIFRPSLVCSFNDVHLIFFFRRQSHQPSSFVQFSAGPVLHIFEVHKRLSNF